MLGLITEIFPFLFFGAFILLVIGLIIFSAINAKKRREALIAFASESGFTYEQEDRGFHESRPFKLFDSGHSKKTTNIMTGSAESVTITICDYRYTTGGGKNSSTHSQTVFLLRKDGMALTHCYLRPENFLDGLGKLFGGQDFNFDEDASFSKAFVLQGEDEKGVRRIFDQDVRDFFVKHPNFHFEAYGDEIILYENGYMKPEKITGMLAVTFELLGLLSRK